MAHLIPVEIDIAAFAQRVPLSVDTSGIFYVEGMARLSRAVKNAHDLKGALTAHEVRLSRARVAANKEGAEDAYLEMLQCVGGMETLFSKVLRDFAIADVLFVTAAEAYANEVASLELKGSEFAQFDVLSPVGKWLLLPRLLRLKWRPTLGSPPLQQFTALVARRNRVVHPKPTQVAGVADVQDFIARLKLDDKARTEGAAAVKELIRKFCQAWTGSFGPSWLEPSSARRRPPCFVLGSPQYPARLGRKRGRGRADA